MKTSWLLLLLAAAPVRTQPTPSAQRLLETCMGFADQYYDDRAAMLWSPMTEDNQPGLPRKHYVRDSAFYAAGLLARGRPGDRERALRIIPAVIRQQIDAPGQGWDGNFYAYLEEPPKSNNALGGNLRQFVGCAFALTLETSGDQIPAPLRERMEQSIGRAVAGELEQHRLPVSYTNISLMQAWLAAYAGVHLHRPDWVQAGEAEARAVDRAFRAYGAFAEYNSPTYYGVDLMALGLWRKFAPTPVYAALGAGLEAGLWRSIAAFYQPSLRNMCGPFDRAYGMDMHQYVAAVAIEMALVLPPAEVPLPAAGWHAEHPHEWDIGICFALAGTRVPADVRPALERFEGEHSIRQPLPDGRLATAWLSDHLMLGAEATGGTRMAGLPVGAVAAHSHDAMATAHWRAPDGSVAWIELLQSPRCDAEAARDSLSIQGVGDYVLRIGAPGVRTSEVGRDLWRLPGLEVQVKTDALRWSVEAGTRPGEVLVRYGETTQLVLATSWRER